MPRRQPARPGLSVAQSRSCFTNGQDTIDLSQLYDIAGFDDPTITADGTTAVIDLSAHGQGTIQLWNVDVDDLEAGDFQFSDPSVSDPSGQDFSASTTTDGRVAVGDSVTGNMGSWDDRDCVVERIALADFGKWSRTRGAASRQCKHPFPTILSTRDAG